MSKITGIESREYSPSTVEEIEPRVHAFLLRHSSRTDDLTSPNARPGLEDVRYLERPAGRIAYSLSGAGPLVICIPGTGDVRSVYRFLSHAVANAGFQVATMDLRGHGDSDVTFERYDDIAVGTDIIALIESLGGPAVLIGNSMGAGAACWAAAEAPALTGGLVLLAPVVREPRRNLFGKMIFRLPLPRLWGRAAWCARFRTRYPTRRGAEYEAHIEEVAQNLRKPGHWDAFQSTTRTSHNAAEASLGKVHAPTLVVMGDKDRDFPDPEAEARWIAEGLQGKMLMVPGAGHYPQAEFPELVSPAVVEFLRRFSPSVTYRTEPDKANVYHRSGDQRHGDKS